MEKKLDDFEQQKCSQIAGRAGRYKEDGSFGVTGSCENLHVDEVERIENHKLDDIKFLFWRNSNLNFKTLSEDLIQSLEKNQAYKNFLKISDNSIDENVLKYLVRDKELIFK